MVHTSNALRRVRFASSRPWERTDFASRIYLHYPMLTHHVISLPCGTTGRSTDRPSYPRALHSPAPEPVPGPGGPAGRASTDLETIVDPDWTAGRTQWERAGRRPSERHGQTPRERGGEVRLFRWWSTAAVWCPPSRERETTAGVGSRRRDYTKKNIRSSISIMLR